MSVFINGCICTVHALFLCTLRVPNALLWVSCRPHPALVTEILKIWHYFSDRSSCDWVMKAGVKDAGAALQLDRRLDSALAMGIYRKYEKSMVHEDLLTSDLDVHWR